jgi:hypothetical protein
MFRSSRRSAAAGSRCPAVELDERPDDALLAQHLRDREDQVGRRRALGQRAVQAEADDLRDQHGHGLAEHRRLGLDAAHAPPQDAEPLTIVVWESVPTSVSG